MKKIFFIFFILIGVGMGCGGSSPTSQGGKSPPPGVIYLNPSEAPAPVEPLPPPPSDKAAVSEAEGGRVVKLYIEPYDHCKGGGCEEKKDRETEEDRQRFSIPYDRK